MNLEFKFEVGQAVWFIGSGGKLWTAEITRRSFIEGEFMTSICYAMIDPGDGIVYDKSECSLFASPSDLLNHILSEEQDMVRFDSNAEEIFVSEQQKILWKVCENFVNENRIKDCEDSQEWDGDRMQYVVRGLVRNICSLVGYYDGEDKEVER